MTIQHLIAQRLNLRDKQVEATLKLLDEGATIPFISRYRKEATGALDEVQVAAVADEYRKVQELEHRKAFVLETIEAQGKLTDELRQRITQSWDATEVEDLYLPFKPKRRTKAQVANEDWNPSLRSCCSVRKTIQSWQPSVFSPTRCPM